MKILRILFAIAGTTWLLMRHTQRVALNPEVTSNVSIYHWIMLGAIFVGGIWFVAFSHPVVTKQQM